MAHWTRRRASWSACLVGSKAREGDGRPRYVGGLWGTTVGGLLSSDSTPTNRAKTHVSDLSWLVKPAFNPGVGGNTLTLLGLLCDDSEANPGEGCASDLGSRELLSSRSVLSRCGENWASCYVGWSMYGYGDTRINNVPSRSHPIGPSLCIDSYGGREDRPHRTV